MLREIFAKIADGKPLNLFEREKFLEMGERLESAESLFSGMIEPGSSKAKLNRPRIESPKWDSSALGSLLIGVNNAVSIPNDTKTFITFEAAQCKNFGDAFSIDSTLQKVSFSNSTGHPFSINGAITWSASSTGYRGLWIEAFDKDDVSMGEMVLHTMPGQNLIANAIPISATWYYVAGMKYIKFHVRHTAGAALDMWDIFLGISVA